jgi:hypothetical protein
MLSNFFAWVKSLGAEEPKKQVATPSRNNPPRRERSEGNRPEGGQQQGNRQRNKPRRDKEETPRSEKPARQENKPQEPRKDKPQRPQRVAIEKPALENIAPVARAEGAEEGGSQDGRKRGRRGGKRERERREQQVTEQAGNTQQFGEANGNVAPASIQQHMEAPQAAAATQASEGLVQVETKASALVNTPPAASTPYQSRRRARPREIYTMENKEPLVQIERIRNS